ncbi:hypothetical protein CHS0354_022078 [Potamilus streckersoni]|uniref:3-hydroxyacyl-CoA dehydrogenase NAD binding domain-containing protein n=1 Tax=Potamilus streckersoni TaxID=2493646 RepID=A0AAE0SS71_9BIVA|nr:hypothetical protein CHS0354_022078 [Potamilus streckersoni]
MASTANRNGKIAIIGWDRSVWNISYPKDRCVGIFHTQAMQCWDKIPTCIRISVTGILGHSMAIVFTSGGYQVALYDKDRGQIQKGLVAIKTKLQQYEADGCLRGNLSASDQFQLVQSYDTLAECVQDAIYVQVLENTPIS